MASATVTVTMDDAGADPAVNGALARCLEAGALDCVSVMASGRHWEEACDMAGESGLPVSVHLNCVEPPFLTDSDFPGGILSWTLYASSLAPAARREWRMQIERLLSRGLMLTRMDGHRHLHHLPPLREAALDLAEEYGIRIVRAAVVPPGDGGLRGLYLRRLGRRLAEGARARGLAATSLMLGFGRSGRVGKRYLQRAERLLDSAGLSGDDEVELVMHPALRPVWSGGQPEELSLLTSDWYGQWSRRNRG
ncbi:MAG: ChbG/HpnK family deacetylase [Candidatus Fermentibacteraceae bacterium]